MPKFQFDQSYGRVLGHAYTALYRRLAKYMREKELPITPDQFRVLTNLWQQDGKSQQELAVSSNRDRANVTRLIDILEREGIVERHDDENDRRAFKIYLTKKGRELEAEAANCAQQAIKDAQKGISKEDIEICMRVLKKTMENLS
jgi:DNA-binding MarR family transcriptional regulator